MQSFAEAVKKGLAINHPLLQEPRPLNQGCGSSFSKAAKKVQEEKAWSFVILFSKWLFGSRGAYTRIGENFYMIGVARQIRWGAGL
jgi:hypothetical protein